MTHLLHALFSLYDAHAPVSRPAGAHFNRFTIFGTLRQLATSIKCTLENNGDYVSGVLRMLAKT